MAGALPYYVTWTPQREAATLAVAGAEGDEFIRDNGDRIYDFTSTSFQAAFGHSHPLIRSRIHAQLDAMPMASPKAAFELKNRVSERLLARLGVAAGGKLFYTVSGAESVENALKIARQFTGRPIVLARKRSYHGATLGAMSVSGDWRSDAHVTFDEGTVRIPEPENDPDLKQTERIVAQTGADRIAAVIVEPISGTNGVCIPPRSWFENLQRLCRDNGVLLIADEVFCGFGRTGTDFAFQHFGVEPDLICISKAISGGYIPLGAVWTSPAIASYYDDAAMVCGLTNYAHPLGLAALDGVLDILDDAGFQKSKRALEQEFAAQVTEMATRFSCSALRCRGLLAALEFGDRQLPSWTHFFDQGLYVFTKGNMLILAPPFISTPARLQRAFADLTTALAR